MLPVLIALYQRSGETELRTRVERQIEAFSGRVAQAPLAGPVFLQGLRQWMSPSPEPLQYLAEGAIRADCRIVESSETQLQVLLRLDIAPGWHIQQHDLQRPESTRLTVVNRDDWQDVELHYPTPERVGSENEGYTGRLDIDLTARERSASPLALELQVQPCNESACLPVETRTFVIHRNASTVTDLPA
ncbi:protein-disulfide reductase DsbD N-terminal domain-containing protein [Modicisalibacter luteus]